MEIESDLRQAALWVDDAAQVAAEPEFAVPHAALRTAAAQLHVAWSGSWLPPLANLYERDLNPVRTDIVLTENGRHERPGAPVDARYRPWTVQEIRAAISARAGVYSEEPLQRSVHAAWLRFRDAQLSLMAALECAVMRRPRDPALSHYTRLTQQIVPVDPSSLIDAWRPPYAKRHGIHARHLDTVPPHIEVLASLDAMQSPFDGLRKIAALMRAAADQLASRTARVAPAPAVLITAEAGR